MYWKLNRIQYPVYNIGPGTRIGIWVQGCSIRCKGCISPSLWSTKNGKNIDVEYLVREISKVQNYFTGITVSGGEPFDQYEPLIAFSAFVKKTTALNVYSFSGYTLAELIKKFPDRLFMSYLDYLLDGCYLPERHENNNARGSDNQNLYKFEQGKPVLQESFFLSKRWSIKITENDQIFMSGIPKKSDLSIIKNHLEKTGVKMEYA